MNFNFTDEEDEVIVKLMADGPSFWYEKLVRETWHIQVAHRTIQVSRTRNMADDRDDKEFQILFFS